MHSEKNVNKSKKIKVCARRKMPKIKGLRSKKDAKKSKVCGQRKMAKNQKVVFNEKWQIIKGR